MSGSHSHHSHSHHPSAAHAGHSHAGHSHGSDPVSASKALKRAIIVTGTFFVIETIGGFLSNSLALLSDAAHMLTDVGALLLSLLAVWIARRPSTPQMSYGYHRAEVLGALLSAVLIWVLAIALLFEAGQRLHTPSEVHGRLALIIAGIGLVANLVSLKMLHGQKDHQLNVRAAYLHVLVDLAGSVGAMLASAIIVLTGWQLADPLITIVLSLGMIWSSWSLVRDSVAVLMEAAPGHVNPTEVRQALLDLEGIEDIHDLHIWSVGSGRAALSVHVIARETDKALDQANHVLEEHFGIIHTTVQIEHPDHFKSERCYECK